MTSSVTYAAGFEFTLLGQKYINNVRNPESLNIATTAVNKIKISNANGSTVSKIHEKVDLCHL